MTSSINGIASDHNDLWTKLLAFITTDSALVAASEEWSLVWSGAGYKKVYRGPGLAGSDQVYIGLDRIDDDPNDFHSIMIYGMTGFNPTAVNMIDHVNVSRAVGFYTDGGSMNYWFTASGRRFMGVVQISTIFESFYAGLFLPYGPPTEYPYPLFIGGSRGDTISGNPSWRNANPEHTNFSNSWVNSGSYNATPTAYMLDPSNTWTGFAYNHGDNDTYPVAAWGWIGPTSWGTRSGAGANSYFTSTQDTDNFWGSNTINTWKTAGLDGSMPLEPLSLAQSFPQNQTYGVLDGVYFVPGYLNAAANTITVDSTVHLVVQNTFRTTNTDYIAMELA